MQGDRCSNGVCWRAGGRCAARAGALRPAGDKGRWGEGRCAAAGVRRGSSAILAATVPRDSRSTCRSYPRQWSESCVVARLAFSDRGTFAAMVVLEGGGALLEPALALDGATAACLERAYAQADVSLKLLPKRYINLHQWLSPVTTSVTAAAAAGKDLKLQIVRDICNYNNDIHLIRRRRTATSRYKNNDPLHLCLTGNVPVGSSSIRTKFINLVCKHECDHNYLADKLNMYTFFYVTLIIKLLKYLNHPMRELHLFTRIFFISRLT